MSEAKKPARILVVDDEFRHYMQREHPRERVAGFPEAPPAARFRMVRYFAAASVAVFLPVAATLLYFDLQKDNFFKQVQQQQDAFFVQMQDSFVQRHDAAAPAYLLSVYEAGNLNLTRLFANALWEKDFAPFVAKAQRIPVDRCRAIADLKDDGGKTVQSGEKRACFAEVGKKIMALPDFKALDARVFDMMKKSTVLKVKVYDLRGIAVYSSEHNQIGEDNLGNAGWKSAMAGKPASELTHRGKFTAFEGEVANRDLATSYVPVMPNGSERIVAVVEVYSDVTQFLTQITSTSSEIRELTTANRVQMERAAAVNQHKVDESANLQHGTVLGLLALLYGALFLIVRNGQRIIDEQDFERTRAEEKLAALAAELEDKVASRTEDLAMALDAATAAGRMKSEFMANITHELRTPLNSVIGFAELLKDEVPGPLNAKQAAFTADILASGERLLALVEGILQMSRLDASGMPLKREPVEISAALEERVAVHRKAAEARGVTIGLEVGPTAGNAQLDPTALWGMLD